MGVAQRHGYSLMTEQPLQGCQLSSCHDEVRSIRMSAVVKSKVFYPSPIASVSKSYAYIGIFVPSGASKNQIDSWSPRISSKERGKSFVHRDRARFTILRVGYQHKACLKVDISPMKIENFHKSHT